MTFTLPLPETPVLATDRLILRPLRLEDASAVQTHFARRNVVRHLLARVPWPFPADGAEIHVRESLEKRAQNTQFFWAITLRCGNDQLIGRIDLRPDAGDGEMRGFWLAEAYWGRGLMTEAADAVTAYAFDVLGWPYIEVTNAAANIGSHRVKEKQGFVLTGIGEDQFVDSPRRKEFWRMTREAWRARHDPRARGRTPTGAPGRRMSSPPCMTPRSSAIAG